MKWLILLLIAACSSAPKYTTSTPLVGVAHGFMHLEETEGVSYYYSFEKPAEAKWLKLNLFFVNSKKKEKKITREQFAVILNGVEIKPESKLATIKEFEALLKDPQRPLTLPILFSDPEAVDDRGRLIKNEFAMVDRYMMEDELSLIFDSPTKTYVLFVLPEKKLKNFELKIAPTLRPVEVRLKN